MFDLMIIGQIAMDTNTDYDGTVQKILGGAVLYSGQAAAALGHNIAVVPKVNPNEIDAVKEFANRKNITVFARETKTGTHMENVYFTADRERRNCRCTCTMQAYEPKDIPSDPAQIYHLAGLVVGDIGGDMIEACSKLGKVAVDVQCLLRRVEDDQSLNLYDWEEKMKYLPMIDYLKTDAAEAEVLTGTSDREEAARMLHSWGAKEIMITHNTEVIVYDGKDFYRAPLKPRNLSGRTGRGDTTFASYLSEHVYKGIQESLNVAAATVSMKMETPGPLLCNRSEIEKYINEVYNA